ncbi:MAG TPA: aminotransferase class I/II-fold pyridoxal phosphate-dependent enzyme, partial [Solirubrobacteraceae bacterium]
MDVFAAAIAAGELKPGAKLPPTRELAEIAGINQLTASRCYRRLQEQGLVVSTVGRGTFVRAGAGAAAGDASDEADVSWQTYALAPPRDGDAGRAIEEAARHAHSPGLIALSVGYPSPEQIPVEQLAAAVQHALEHEALASFEYCPIEGTDELRAQLAALGRERGLSDEADSILVTTGARQGLTLVARAVLRPGDVVACESPTYMGMIEA